LGSVGRQALDPLPLFPLEFNFRNDLYRAHVEVCNTYLHNIKSLKNEVRTEGGSGNKNTNSF
jgi:hypothetical protein